jgi:endothelin-converting enzyme
MCYGTYEHSGVGGSVQDDIDKRTQNILRKILESNSHADAVGVKSTLVGRSNADEYNFDMLRGAYQACMDLDTIQAAGVTPLTNLITTIDNAWPVSAEDLKTKLSPADFAGLHKATLAVEQLGVNVFHALCREDSPAVPDFLNSVSPKTSHLTCFAFF